MTTRTEAPGFDETAVKSNGSRKPKGGDVEQSAKNLIAHFRGGYYRVMVEDPHHESRGGENLELFEALMLCQLAGGHLFVEDEPGVGKTQGTKAFAALQAVDFKRIQLTPDLLPREITGWPTPNGFHQGAIFTNILLLDEIRRASPKTQSGLLEVMEEGQVTVDGVTREIEDPFTAVATTNPQEHEGTYPLPQAEVDRFAMFINVTPPRDRKARGEIARRNRNGGPEAEPLVLHEGVALNKGRIVGLQRTRAGVEVPAWIEDAYVPAIVDSLREHKSVERKPPGVRAEVWLPRLAQARALILGQAEVTAEHVDYVAYAGLSHRFDVYYGNDGLPVASKAQVIRECLKQARAERPAGKE